MPSPAARRYHDALHDARLQAAALVREIDAGLIRAYARALLDIQREFRTGVISEERANLLSGAIRTRLARFGSQVEQVLAIAILQAAEIGVGGHIAGIVPYSHSFEGVAEEAIERMVRRRLLPEVEGAYSSVFRSIIARNLQDVASDIDDYLESAVIRGVSGERAGKELAAIMARNDPEVERIIGRKLKGAPEDALKRARTLMHDAKRIAVHEINSAYDEADKLAAARSPAILAVRWRTSGRHGGLSSSPDICFAAGTLVETDRGGVPIEDIRIGTRVLTHAGRYQPVTRLYQSVPQTAVLRLHFLTETGQHLLVDATRNHPFLTEAGWTQAGDLQMGSGVFALHQFESPQSCGTSDRASRDYDGSVIAHDAQTDDEERCDEYTLHQCRTTRTMQRGSLLPNERHSLQTDVSGLCFQTYGLGFPCHASSLRDVGESRPAFATRPHTDFHSSDYPHPSISGDTPPPYNLLSSGLGRLLRPLQSHSDKLGTSASFDHAAQYDDTAQSNSCGSEYRLGDETLSPRTYHTAHLPGWYGSRIHTLLSRIAVACSDLLSSTAGTGYQSRSAHMASAWRRFCETLQHTWLRNESCEWSCDPLSVQPSLDVEACHNSGTFGRAWLVSSYELRTIPKHVFNIEVSGDHTYVAGGIVVHNCDVIEQADVYGMGAGVYPPEYVPSLTHPFCLCSTEKVIRPVEDWGKPKPPLPAMYRNLSRGDVGGLMGRRVNDYSRSVTKKHIERQHELASELIRRAYETGRQLRATG